MLMAGASKAVTGAVNRNRVLYASGFSNRFGSLSPVCPGGILARHVNTSLIEQKSC